MGISKMHFATVAVAALLFVRVARAGGPVMILLQENFDELSVGETQTNAGAFSAIGGTNIDVVDQGSP